MKKSGLTAVLAALALFAAGCGSNTVKEIDAQALADSLATEITYDDQLEAMGVERASVYFDLEDGKVRNVQFLGGCNGNLKGIGQLVEGMDVDDVIAKLEGTTCGMKKTSCPDQLAQALKEAKANG